MRFSCRLGHLDDVSAIVGEQRAAEVAGYHLTQVQHLRSRDPVMGT